MLLLRTAFKNILGGGKRTWLNVTVLSFTFVIMVAYNGILDGFLEEARRETQRWETGAGQIQHPEYDRYDMFTLQDAHGVAPLSLQTYLADKSMTPILILQAAIYPQGRFQNILLKGIDAGQNILELPTAKLRHTGTEIPVIIGQRMAGLADLKEGDRVMLRWRDKQGVFDAQEIVIAAVFKTKTTTVDAGQMWINITDLYAMTGMQDEATYLVKSENCPVVSDIDNWSYKDLKYLLADIDLMAKSNQTESFIIFAILLAIALLAVFDTQMLSIFRRQKEIGTYVALGMTPKRVSGLFTLEGTSYSILAVLMAAVWGTPLLYLFAQTGMKMPEVYADMGMGMSDAIYPAYHVSSIMTSIIVIVVLSAIISYLPARRIAKQNIVFALKGKIN
ncbi:MAG: FtsX-like permease family protein [Candidatus Symbiothrix sp.]|jgi:ABC-type lipoprotein release transport system permease subunit|nr:FtsX-like permease family protein [Candidatus Symbiothrix sp.]